MKKTICLKKYEPFSFINELIKYTSVYKYILLALIKYNGYILNKDNAYEILSDLRDIISENEIEIPEFLTQDHKEAGFDYGWPSRFDTWYKLAKELGFVYYEMNAPIEFSQAGIQLVKSIEPEYSHLENQVFLNALVKYERDNPFRCVLNSNKPLILLLQVIQELKLLEDGKSPGLSILEIPLLLCWHDNDYKALATLINHIRKQNGYTPSEDIIYEKCKILLDVNTIRGEKRFKKSNILREMPDEFIRKMRLTGLVSLRGCGRFIDVNTFEIEKINYCIKQYSKSSTGFSTKREYFEYMKNIDANLVSIKTLKVVNLTEKEKLFQKWVNNFSFETIKNELLIVCNSRKSSKDEILKYISEPVRFEFLTALSLAKVYQNLKIQANYNIDDEGLPTSFAPGGGADIICKDELGNILFEVTLLTGTQQNIREMPAIHRHLEDVLQKSPNSFSVMLCPRPHIDTISYSEWLKDKKKIIIAIYSIDDYITNLDNQQNIRQYIK